MPVERRRWERTFDGRIILVHEMSLDQLDRQAGLSDTTSSNDDELILSQELEGLNVSKAQRQDRLPVCQDQRFQDPRGANGRDERESW